MLSDWFSYPFGHSLCLTLCNQAPCLFWHKISLPVHVRLNRFYCNTIIYNIRYFYVHVTCDSLFLTHLWGQTFIPNDCILRATSFPIRPNPTIPSVFPYSSHPMRAFLSDHFFSFMARSPLCTFLKFKIEIYSIVTGTS